jgi:ribosomal protein S13
MKFSFTPEEAQGIGIAVARHFRKAKGKPRIEAPAWDGAPYRTTLLFAKGQPQVFIDCQASPSYGTGLKELAVQLAAKRLYAELYIATGAEAVLSGQMLQALSNDGVGLFLVADNGMVARHSAARNAALVVTPDPTLKLGDCKQETQAALEKFNDVNRKDGLRDMCDLVERETKKVALKASRKGVVTASEQAIESMDWSTQINHLASAKGYAPGRQVLVDDKLKNDIHSFRGARNLLDHPVRGKRQEAKRERQFAERMVQGPRLVAELVSLRRKLG